MDEARYHECKCPVRLRKDEAEARKYSDGMRAMNERPTARSRFSWSHGAAEVGKQAQRAKKQNWRHAYAEEALDTVATLCSMNQLTCQTCPHPILATKNTPDATAMPTLTRPSKSNLSQFPSNFLPPSTFTPGLAYAQ